MNKSPMMNKNRLVKSRLRCLSYICAHVGKSMHVYTLTPHLPTSGDTSLTTQIGRAHV